MRDVAPRRPRVGRRGALVGAAAALLGWEANAVAGSPTVEGAEAVRAQVAREGRVTVIAELARPAGTELPADAVERARAALARDLAAAGVVEVRGLGSLPYVALEVDARQLEALLATGKIAAVAADRPVRPR